MRYLTTCLVTIRGFLSDTFRFRKGAIFRKFQEIGGIARKRTVVTAAQAIPPTCHVYGVIEPKLWKRAIYGRKLSEG
jgi:hypothetical protein